MATRRRYCPRCFESFAATHQQCPTHNRQLVALASDSDSLAGRELDDKYEVVELIGKGGMGTVYRARQMPIGREVAVKVLRRDYLEGHQGIARFVREARAASMLKSRYSAMLHDFGLAQDGYLYYTMELATGRLLSDIIDRDGALGVERTLHLAADICHSLAEAHAHGIVHRDIKPDNIMVTTEGDGHEIGKVLDFGTAKLIHERELADSVTDPGIVCGTPEYMSPEQAQALPLDGRSDVYSLGVLMYEMLTGIVPFTGRNGVAVLLKQVNDPVPPLATGDSEGEVPVRLERLVRRMLAKRPQERPDSVVDVLRELRELLEEYVSHHGSPERFNVRQHASFRLDEILASEPGTGGLAPERSDTEVDLPVTPASPAPAESPCRWGRWMLVGGIVLSLLAAGLLVGEKVLFQ